MKLKRQDIVFFVLGVLSIATYVWPYYMTVLIPGFNGIMIMVFRYMSYLITVMTAIICRKELFALLKKSLVFIVLYLALYIALLLSTVFHSGKQAELIEPFIKVFFFSLLLAVATANKSSYMLKGMAFVYNAIIVISLINAFVPFPGLSGVEYFATTKNVYFRFIFLGIMLDAYLDYREAEKLRIRTLVFLGMIVVTTLLFRSSTGFAVSFVSFALLLIKTVFMKGEMKMAKSWLFLLIAVAIGILVVFLRQISFYADFIESVFGKDASFTGRVDLWDQVLKLIAKNPVFGYGHLSMDGYIIFGNEHWMSASCHNLYLDIMVEAGIIGLVIFFIMLLILLRNIDRCEYSSMAQTFSILFFACLIAFNFEVYFNLGQYIYTFPMLFFLSFCFAGSPRRHRKLRIIWK